MDPKEAANTPSTEIEKCPYYDPLTRETVKPGKTCPEYNSTKGCPYAHPWEYEKWDGEVLPFARAAIPNGDPPLPRPPVLDQKQTDHTVMSNHPETTSERMEVDEWPSHPSTPLDVALTLRPKLVTDGTNALNLSRASHSTPDTPSTHLQTEALSSFLAHIIGPLHQNQVLERVNKSISNLKSLYNRYSDVEEGDLKGMVPPATRFAWLKEHKAKMEEIEDAENSRWAWIDVLASMSEEAKEAPLRTTGGDDLAMPDAITPAPEPTRSEAEMQVLHALSQYRARLHRGAVGERLEGLRTRLDQVRPSVERNSLEQGTPRGLIANANDVDTDTEMKDRAITKDTENLLKTVTADIGRLEDLLTRSENMSSPIDEADHWGTTHPTDKKFVSELQVAIDRIAQEFITRAQEEEEAVAVASGRPVSVQRTKAKETLEKLKQTVEELADIRISSEALMRILGGASVFDPDLPSLLSIVTENLADTATSSETYLKSLVGDLTTRTTLYSTVHDSDRTEILQRTTAFHLAALKAHPSITDAISRAPPIPNLPSRGAIQDQQTATWLREFEELKERAVKIVAPFVERTEVQEAKLMSYGLEQRGTAAPLHGEEGGPVSMQVSG